MITIKLQVCCKLLGPALVALFWPMVFFGNAVNLFLSETPLSETRNPLSLDGATVLIDVGRGTRSPKPSQWPLQSGMVCAFVNVHLVKGECRGTA